MSLETSVLKLCVAVSRGADRGLSERMTSCIKGYSWWGAVIMALPLFGLDTLIYVILLWSMYGKISSLSGVPFSGHAMKNILGGFIVNILIVFVLNMVLDFILFFGWIGSAIVGYWGTKLSGQSYVEVLVQLHGRNNVREHLDYQAFKEGFQGKTPESELPKMTEYIPPQTPSVAPPQLPPKYIPPTDKAPTQKGDLRDVQDWWC